MQQDNKSINQIVREGMDYGPVRLEAVFVVASLYLAEQEALKQQLESDAAELAMHKIRRAQLMDLGILKLDEGAEFDSEMGMLWDNYVHSTCHATSIETAAMLKAFDCKPSPPSPEDLEIIELERMLLLEDPRENK